MPSPTVSKTESKWKAILAGVQTILPAKSSLLINGKPMSQAQMVATLQSQLALFTAAAQAKSLATAAVAKQRAGMAAGVVFVKLLIAGLKYSLGENNPQLTQFGISLPKPKAALSPGKKAVANVRRQNTRQARGVLGKNQRAAIQPNVVPTQVTVGPDGNLVDSTPAAGASAVAAAAPVAGK